MSWIAESWSTVPKHMRVLTVLSVLTSLPGFAMLAESLGYPPLLGVLVAIPVCIAACLVGLRIRYQHMRLQRRRALLEGGAPQQNTRSQR